MKKIFYALLCFALVPGVLRCATIVNQRVGYVDMNRVIEASPETKEIKDELMADLRTRRDNIKIFQNRIDSLEKEVKTMEAEMSKYEQSLKQQAISPQPSADISVSSPAALSPDLSAQSEMPRSSLFVSSAQAVVQPAAVAVSTSAMPSSHQYSTPPVNTLPAVAPVMAPQEQYSPAGVQASTASPQGVAANPVAVSSPSFTQADIEGKKDLLSKQKLDLDEYKSSTDTAEKNMNKKIKKNLLGKIYDSVKEVSEEEGLTIVLDSSNVLYDEGMTDITDKVVEKLKKK